MTAGFGMMLLRMEVVGSHVVWVEARKRVGELSWCAGSVEGGQVQERVVVQMFARVAEERVGTLCCYVSLGEGRGEKEGMVFGQFAVGGKIAVGVLSWFGGLVEGKRGEGVGVVMGMGMVGVGL